MAGPAKELDRPFHVRSISMPSTPQPAVDRPFHVWSIIMPSTPQPAVLKVEEELQKLRPYMTSSTSSTTPQMVCNGLRELGNVFDCIKDVLQHSPCNLHQNKWVEEELDQSIKLLDLGTSVKDTLVAMKEHAQDLSLSLRRKDAVPENKLRSYTILEKKAQKEIKKCLRSCKQNNKKCSRSISIYDKNSDLSMVVNMFMEAREITISLLQSVLPSLSEMKIKSNESKWSFLSKALQQRKVACEDDLAFTSETENLECLEKGLECLFKHLLRYRVSLLNTISL